MAALPEIAGCQAEFRVVVFDMPENVQVKDGVRRPVLRHVGKSANDDLGAAARREAARSFTQRSGSGSTQIQCSQSGS
jgi:hypothetical protein